MVSIRVRSMVWFATGVVVALLATMIVMQTWRADAAPGDTDATFVPITPCRLIDTRPAPNRVGPHGAFGIDHTQTIEATGTNGNCTIPDQAVGLSLNVTAVGATQPTFLTIWPDGDRPDASSLNPAPGQPPTPNAVTSSLSGDGSFRIYNLQGVVNVIVDVNGYYTHDLANRIAALESAGVPQAVLDRLNALEADVATLEAANTAQQAEIDALEAANTAQQAEIDALETTNTAQQAEIDALEALTASMSLETVDGYPVVRFTGVNVQVVSGSGATSGVLNGTGNLIVGYHENDFDTRTGSHNLIVGRQHSYSSYGGFLAGHNNIISGAYASVSGGHTNEASGNFSSMSGGFRNQASSLYSSVSGGSYNEASALFSSVSGGSNNTASGEYSSILGGRLNEVSGDSSTVAGGVSNNASGNDDVIAGGDNINCGYSDAVLCGEYTSFTAGWDLVD